MKQRNSKLKVAADFMSELSADATYQQRKRDADAERDVRTRQLQQAEKPILDDLHEAGVDVSSVWDLVNTSDPYPQALPILFHHLKRGTYPDRVMEGVARALAVPPAAPMWAALRDLYLASRGHGEAEGLAVALSASVTPAHLEDLISLLDHKAGGDTRIHFLKSILRLGGQRGHDVVASLRSNPTFGKEARALIDS